MTLLVAPPSAAPKLCLPTTLDLRTDAAENSIMQTITIAVSAILIAAGLVTAPGLINNARDNNARTDLANAAFAQEMRLSGYDGNFANPLAPMPGTILAAASTSSSSGYARTVDELKSGGIKLTLSGGVDFKMEVSDDGSKYLMAAKSQSGKIFYRVSQSADTFTGYTEAKPSTTLPDPFAGDERSDDDGGIAVACNSNTTDDPGFVGYKDISQKVTVCDATGATVFAYGYDGGDAPLLEDNSTKESPRLYLANGAQLATTRFEASYTMRGGSGTSPSEIRLAKPVLTNTMTGESAPVSCEHADTGAIALGETASFDCSASISVTNDWSEWAWSVPETQTYSGGTGEGASTNAMPSFNAMVRQG
ncbi:hypothetical protein [Frigoribacterium sp. 9N]|uniref:hypothetical protein n=1 Tax=Frigoribacterium sp. 9N TaxID=2653144 RepID=UPI0012F0A5C7|nr:hypothetical protein [Frigoribacterium sp. 9N]VXB75280.1 hypothetical protein FRIGORI9N_420016 [Frigoribacterium sp. 9N]